MKELLKKYIMEAVKDALYQAATKENLKLILQFVLDKLSEAALQSENKIDDWVVSMISGWVTDENVDKIWEYLISSKVNVYGAQNSDLSLHRLAEQLAPDGKVYASPTLPQVLSLLQTIISILYEWFYGKAQQ